MAASKFSQLAWDVQGIKDGFNVSYQDQYIIRSAQYGQDTRSVSCRHPDKDMRECYHWQSVAPVATANSLAASQEALHGHAGAPICTADKSLAHSPAPVIQGLAAYCGEIKAKYCQIHGHTQCYKAVQTKLHVYSVTCLTTNTKWLE